MSPEYFFWLVVLSGLLQLTLAALSLVWAFSLLAWWPSRRLLERRRDRFVSDVLARFGHGDRQAPPDDLVWLPDGEGFRFLVSCPDVFRNDPSDAVELTRERLPELDRAVADAAAAAPHGECWAGVLFCARVLGTRPRDDYYPFVDEPLWPLLDACGPARGPAE